MASLAAGLTSKVLIRAGNVLRVAGVAEIKISNQQTNVSSAGSFGPFDFNTDVDIKAVGSVIFWITEIDGGTSVEVRPPSEVWAFPLNSAGVQAAIDAVSESGQPATVRLHPVAYEITSKIVPKSGVSLRGVQGTKVHNTGSNVPDFWMPGGGTIFDIAPGVTAIGFNDTDLGSLPAGGVMAKALQEFHIYGITAVGGDKFLKIGAVNNPGCFWGSIDQCSAYNQTAINGYAIDICNSMFFTHGEVNVLNNDPNAVGGNYRICSNLPKATLICGDSHVHQIFSRVESRLRKGVVFEAGGVAAAELNDVKVIGRIHSSRYNTPATPYTASFVTTINDPNISVPADADFNLCQVGMPFRWISTVPDFLNNGVTYFVISRNTSNKTIQISEAEWDVAITPLNSGTHSVYISGWPTFMARADTGSDVKNCNFGDLACEATGSIGNLYFSITNNCNAHNNNPSISYTGTSIICRNAQIGITYSGSPDVTQDASTLTYGQCNFTNLAGGVYRHTSGNITLTPSWNGRQVRYSGSGAITVTIPRYLPAGFAVSFITSGTGIITFALAGSSNLSLLSTGSPGAPQLRSTGQNSKVSLEQIDQGTYFLSGNTQV
jgi:hypothetical protein